MAHSMELQRVIDALRGHLESIDQAIFLLELAALSPPGQPGGQPESPDAGRANARTGFNRRSRHRRTRQA